MSRYHSYINSATLIIDTYKGQEPLAVFLKQFFAREKKYGSKDRKQVSSLCYHYFRVVAALDHDSKEEQLLMATFLCEKHPSDLLANLRPEWNEKTGASYIYKSKLLKDHFNEKKLFPFSGALSAGMDEILFAQSFLEQPQLFIRVRPGYEKTVPAKLKAVSAIFDQVNNHCIAMPNGSRVYEEIIIDKEAVIQDYSSQMVGEFIRPFVYNRDSKFSVWDCCAASGGKSILLFDINNKVRLTVSDIRVSILHNLRNRFQRAGIHHYQSFTADLTEGTEAVPDAYYQMIIADVPCTGSGTWARTPEQLYYFKQELIELYATRQRKIVQNIVGHLEKKGILLYITCSVFQMENEMQVGYMQQELGLELLKMELLKGYNNSADTMFVAVLEKK